MAVELIVMLHCVWLLVVGDLPELEGPEGNVKCQTNRGQQEIQTVTSELSASLCQAHQIRHLHSRQCEQISVHFYQVAYG